MSERRAAEHLRGSQSRPIVQLVGVPMDLGGNRRGVDMGPSAIRYAGLAAKLADIGYRVRDRGNIRVKDPDEGRASHAYEKYEGERAGPKDSVLLHPHSEHVVEIRLDHWSNIVSTAVAGCERR